MNTNTQTTGNQDKENPLPIHPQSAGKSKADGEDNLLAEDRNGSSLPSRGHFS